MSNQQALVVFLRALLAAKKSLALYPPESDAAKAWIERLRRSLDDAFRQGLIFPIRLGRDRFAWAGGELRTTDRALKGLQFEMQSRGIIELSIEPSVENWELQALLELLNKPVKQFASITAANGYLRDRAVVHVSIAGPGLGGLPGPPGHSGLGWGTGTEESGSGAGSGAMLGGTDADALELLVESILKMVDERFQSLAYDRSGLLEWFQTISRGGRVDALYAAVIMLGAMARGSGDREVRARTTLEALMLLPDATLGPFFTDHLLPGAASDLTAFNLLTQVTEDELRQIARHVPRERLVALTTELLEYPWEEGKRLRLLEAITLTLERRAEPAASPAEPTLLSQADPLLLELRQEIIDACRPDALLSRSADVLMALIGSVHPGEYTGFAAEALGEIAREALAGDQADLALRVLRSVAIDATHEVSRESATRTALIRRKLAEHSHVSLVANLLRREPPTGPMEFAPEYLRLAGPEAVEVFTALLADEPHRRVRIRMCEVLARVGVPAIPPLLSRLGDKRWFVVRNALYTLRKIGHASAFPAIVPVLEHAHARVRLEAVRVAIQVGGGAARAPVLRRVHDPDTSVKRAAISAVGTPGNDAAVSALRKVLLGSGARSEDDAEVQFDTIRALAAIGTSAALDVLKATVSRRAWFWKRADRRVRDLAEQTLGGGTPRARVSPEAVDDR
ncbi:MAG: hypothetical protein AUH14_08675 [Candidatus Rokubacteria bacterium 13_2_20CM_69_15_1]|nr:MAG: hypothetical protein AUH14_08675 [Candidatus Rokubacteria bacterium 13_2_20CM_69_15_1]